MPTGDPYKRAQAGQPLQIGAEVWNDVLDTTKAFKAQKRGQSMPGDTIIAPHGGHILIKNTTGTNLDRFAVVGIGTNPIIDPADNAPGFAERPATEGVTPTADHVGGRFAVLLEPVANGAFGLGVAGGISVMKVNVSDAGHWFADVADGSTTELVSAPAGPVQLLQKQSGTGAGKWAIGRFGGGGGTAAQYGKLTAPWSPGTNTVILQPVADSVGNPFDPVPDTVNCYIISPFTRSPAYLLGEVNDVFPYDVLGAGIYQLRNPQTTPIPSRKWEVIQAVNDTLDPAEWACDYMRGHQEE